MGEYGYNNCQLQPVQHKTVKTSVSTNLDFFATFH